MTTILLRSFWGLHTLYRYCDYTTVRIRITFAWTLLSMCQKYVDISTPGQGWMWWRKSRRRTALRQRRPVSSRCRKWWGGKGWNHNGTVQHCVETRFRGHAKFASCCINITSIIKYQHYQCQYYQNYHGHQNRQMSQVLLKILVPSPATPSNTPKMKTAHFWDRAIQSSSSSHIFPQDCGELPVEWGDFFAWRKSKTVL